MINAGKPNRDRLPALLLLLGRLLAMIRAGKIDLSILGAMQVSEKGDIANLDGAGSDGQGDGKGRPWIWDLRQAAQSSRMDEQ